MPHYVDDLPYLSVVQAADELNVSRATLFRWIKKGMPSVKVQAGRRFYRRVDPVAVRRWLADQYRETPEGEQDE